MGGSATSLAEDEVPRVPAAEAAHPRQLWIVRFLPQAREALAQRLRCIPALRLVNFATDAASLVARGGLGAAALRELRRWPEVVDVTAIGGSRRGSGRLGWLAPRAGARRADDPAKRGHEEA